MANPYFRFKQFTVHHDRCAMKVTTDACLFGAWAARLFRGQKGKALDIGTGTGLLSLMVAQESGLRIDAVELDGEAAAQARENVDASPWKERICIHAEDIRAFEGSGYDLIFSNPPFYETDLRSENEQKNRAHHSTELPLQELIGKINSMLTDNGSFLLLLPARREAESLRLIEAAGLHTQELLRVRQSLTHSCFRVLIRGGKQPETGSIREMAICSPDGAYSPEFSDLLKVFYLYL